MKTANNIPNQLAHRAKTAVLWLKRVLGPRWKQILKWLGLGLVAVAAATVLVAGIGIYALGWQNRFTIDVSRFVPYPAVWADNHLISYHDYATGARSLTIYHGQLNKTGQTKASSRKELNQAAYQQQVNLVIIRKYAAEHGLTVSDEEVVAQVNSIYADQGGMAKTLKLVKAQYGWSKLDFVDQVRNQLLASKVAKSVAADPAAEQKARASAQSILKQIQAGADFIYLQQRYSVHPTATETGDRMLITTSALPSALSDPMAKLSDGQIASEVVQSGTAFYILRREKTVNGQVMVRLIEISPPGAGQWLSTEYQKAHVFKLLPQLRGL